MSDAPTTAEYDPKHPNPAEDGITHINAYSKARTELGQLLTNFAFTPFKHPTFGHFASVEAFWYWYGTGKQHDQLRRLHGASAKAAGRKYPRVEVEDFQERMKEAVRLKIEQTPEILQRFRTEPPLPVAHYYVYGANPPAVINKPEHNWLFDFMEKCWREIYANAHPS